MHRIVGSSRRALLAGTPLAFAASLTTQPATAKKGKKKKEKPPIGYCIAYVESSIIMPESTPPELGANWRVLCYDYRAERIVARGPSTFLIGTSPKRRDPKERLLARIASMWFAGTGDNASRIMLDLF